MRSLGDLRRRLDRASAAVPQPLPEATSTDAIKLSLAVGLVLHRLELWASTRPGYEPMSPPTVWHKPDDADRRMAAQCPQLAALAEARLIHTPDVLPARLGALYARYTASGEHDEGIDAALADVRDQLPAFEATGADVPRWCAKFLSQIAGNSAAQATEQ